MEPAVEPHTRLVLADLVSGRLVEGRGGRGGDVASFPHEARHSAGPSRAVGSNANPRREAAMADHYHAIVWIDHKQARVFHFNVEEADRTVVKDHIVRDLHSREPRTGQRIGENKPFFDDDAKAIADASAILIVGPAQEKDFFAKFLAEKDPPIRAPSG